MPQRGGWTCLRHTSRHRCWETLLGSWAWALHWTIAVIALPSYSAEKHGTLTIIKCHIKYVPPCMAFLMACHIITLTSIAPKSDRNWQRVMLGKERRSWGHRQEGGEKSFLKYRKKSSLNQSSWCCSFCSSLHLPKALQKSLQSCTRVEGSHWLIRMCMPDMPESQLSRLM